MAEKVHSKEQLKKARSVAKAKITRKINAIKEFMSNQDNLAIVKDQLGELHDDLKAFKNAHEAYHSQLTSESDLRESNDYRVSVERITKDFEHETGIWLAQIAQNIEKSFRRQSDSEVANIRPEDSISNVGSRASYRTRSSCGSIRSTTSARAKAAAKKAALEVEVEILERLQQLEVEELVLQPRKRQLQLRGEIAAAEAEREVYERVESEVRSDISLSSVRVKQTLRSAPDERNARSKATRDENNPSIDKPKITSNSTPVSGNNELNNFHEESFRKLVEVQDHQNNALQQLIHQQQQGVMALTLPKPSLQTFSGNPIDYCDFIQSFEHLIESKTSSPRARLYYLIQHTSGSAQDLMKSCLSMHEGEGYLAARKLLKERFGQSYRVAAAHVQQLIDGPPIKNEDGAALQQFSVQLTSCTNTLERIGYLEQLNNSENLKKIIDRLPYAIRMKWRDTVDRIIEREARDVTVKDVNDFVTAKARATTHPIFGKISTPEPKGKHPLNPKMDRVKRTAGFLNQAASKPLECSLCGSNHWLSRCEKFRKQSLEERQRLVKEKKLCNNCLVTDHYVRSCSKESFCKVQGCSGKHSTFLHPKLSETPRNNESQRPKETAKDPDAKDDTAAANNGYIKSSVPKNNSVIGLAIVPVQVRVSGSSQTVETYALLDSGSNTTFCTDELLEKLGTTGKRTALSLTTMQGENAPIECSLVSLEISDLEGNNDIELPMVYSRPSLPVPVEAIGKQEDVNRWPHLSGVKIASINEDVGLLIGNDTPNALQPREIRQSENGGPFATRTALGWTLNGPLGGESTKVPTTNFVQANQNLERQFQHFCNLEFNDNQYDPKPTMSRNDLKAIGIMEETAKLENGHYEIALPWKTYPPNLPNNRSLAENRLQLLKKRLRKDPNLHGKYKEFMDNLLIKDHACKAFDQNVGPLGSNWYIPHHPVFHPQKPGKVRVVFDCSAKYGNTSLNDKLLQGPDLTNSLVGVLTRFRQEPVAFISDIEAMFYQVRVRPSDRNALRFLWWPNGNLDEPPEECQMNVHLFGGVSSPSCANYALKKTATDNAAHFDDQTVETVQRNFYVDDCLKSVSGEDEAVKLVKELREMLSLGGFNLTKWLSNSKKVLESIPELERAAQVKNLDFDQTPIERALGVQWNVSSDTFGFSVVIKDRPATRRGILSTVSSVYDPLGFVAPFVLSAKLILQDLCRLKLDWDDKIPEEFLNRWQAWLIELPNLEKLAINRCLFQTINHARNQFCPAPPFLRYFSAWIRSRDVPQTRRHLA